MKDIFTRALAEADSEIQAEFLNSFYAHLKVCCGGKHDTQLCYIAGSLDSNGREFVTELCKFAELSVESRAKVETQVEELYRQRRSLEAEIAGLEKAKKELNDFSH